MHFVEIQYITIYLYIAKMEIMKKHSIAAAHYIEMKTASLYFNV